MNGSSKVQDLWAHPIRAVAFDMDGLLVNTEELYTHVGSSILARRGKQFSDELKNAMTGLPGPHAFSIMIEREKLSDTIEVLEAESQAIFHDILPKKLRLLSGVEPLLDRLDQLGLPKCVATSSSPQFAQTVLSAVKIIHRFQFIITTDDVDRGKPHPDIYLAAARRMSVEPQQMAVLDDSHHGCRAGINSGACTIAVPGPHSTSHDFTGVCLVAESLLDPAIYGLLVPMNRPPS